jgi:hypothetical protein
MNGELTVCHFDLRLIISLRESRWKGSREMNSDDVTGVFCQVAGAGAPDCPELHSLQTGSVESSDMERQHTVIPMVSSKSGGGTFTNIYVYFSFSCVRLCHCLLHANFGLFFASLHCFPFFSQY